MTPAADKTPPPSPDLPLFQRPAWLQQVTGGNWATAGDTTTATLPYHRLRRRGTTVIAHPPLTPFLQLQPADGQYPPSRRAVEELLDRFPTHARADLLLDYAFDAWEPFYRRGWTCAPRYSYQLNLSVAPAPRLAAYKYSLRRTVNRAPEALRLAPLPPEGAHRRFERHLTSRNSSTGVSEADFNALYRRFAPAGALQLWGLYRQEILLASLCLAVDRGTAYCLLTERDEQRDDVHAMHLLYHRVIEHCAAAGLHTFDFNGSMLPGVAAFNRAFGGTRRTKYQLTHYGNRFWKAAYALLGR